MDRPGHHQPESREFRAEAARLNPIDPTRDINLTTPVSFTAKSVPRWRTQGGVGNVNVTNFYLPMYWATMATPPLASNDPHTLVEIKQAPVR